MDMLNNTLNNVNGLKVAMHNLGCKTNSYEMDVMGQKLTSAGRVSLSLLEIPEAEAREAEFRILRDTVASLRLDAVVGCGFGLAREKAASAIRTGKVAVGGMECLKPDKLVEAGSRISLRGLGKMELSEVGGLSRKGRIQIVIKRYI